MALKHLIIALLLVVSMVTPAFALDSIPVQIRTVEVSEVDLITSDDRGILHVDRNQVLDIEVETVFSDFVENARVSVTLNGYEYGTLRDETDIFDARVIDQPLLLAHKLQLELPDDIDAAEYTLRVEVNARNRAVFQEDFDLRIAQPRRDIVIDEIFVSPTATVKAGSAVYLRSQLENFGEKDETDVRFEIGIPELGLRDVDFLKELKSSERQTTEEVFFRIPPCTTPGTYTVEAFATFSRGHEQSDTKKTTIEVTEGSLCLVGQTLTHDDVTFGSFSQSAKPGDVLSLPLTITNNAKVSQSYTVTLEGTESLGRARVSPSNE